MAKAKKGPPGGAQRHIRARLEYLHKAAAYLQGAAVSPNLPTTESSSNEQEGNQTLQASPSTNLQPSQTNALNRKIAKSPLVHLSQQYISHMRGVSLKTQLRLPIPVKRSFCKRCGMILTSGVNSVQELRNESKNSKKPWANVLVIRCMTCGTEKRFPQTPNRGKKLSERRKEKDTAAES
ncbi:hypothetical protein ASPZODRAFT_19778 [Penicilliopsis zonata CBS 506.65]|uniref:Rpr2-domain-containing protein n=1 Tax=Penicilliopsis zonata CBS 506.65 TaxID=1073090 RepID=A0A1L9S7F1_9EURO|nr:hypothetical protein ASPZODRAFT_19778 [Penicilliopsis zonata CBS 506.65]OJJ43080.1 hypothetical protein ASPZODRAFT_19778 [Penicilliopsis zonata CBS 506.65]